jgi:hypothetical protein
MTTVTNQQNISANTAAQSVAKEETNSSPSAAWGLLALVNNLTEEMSQFQVDQSNVSLSLSKQQEKISKKILGKTTALVKKQRIAEYIQLAATAIGTVLTVAMTAGLAAPAIAMTLGAQSTLMTVEGGLMIASGAMEIDQATDERSIDRLRSGSKNISSSNKKLSDDLKQSLSATSSIKRADVGARKKMGTSHNIHY